ncbi:hypothetical protein [Streptomyces nanshensis]|uniref:Uncharacterized protein n=1 Tax=Streptomyces nanshensis TaxID=518642 RepID=A0A1E7L4I3_9ACTN|nr:hypothetical protein [Streptomyces nanshensis]OEV11092.1 hypothetical protein AN218_14520 [Streptomyces nanshensis]
MPTSAKQHPADKTAQRPQVVPYIAQWSAEGSAPRPQVVTRRGRIAFVDERRYDRDADGILWTRVPFQPGKGTPQFGHVHALRQRNAMERLLCHVCGRPADSNSDGVLWLLTEEPRCPPEGGSGDVVTEHPPLCLPCAHIAIAACPRLRHDFTAVRVRAFERAGVRGALYQRATPHPVPIDVVSVAFDNPAIGWVRAGKLLLRLTDYQPVDLYAEDHVPTDERSLLRP